MSEGEGRVVGRAEHLIDFSRARVGGFTLKLLVALAALFLLLAAFAAYVALAGGTPSSYLKGALATAGCALMALLFLWMLSLGREQVRELAGARFRLGYEVRAGEGGYVVELRLSADALGRVGRVRLSLVTARSYARLKTGYRSARVLRGGEVLEAQLVADDAVAEGYAKRVTVRPGRLECVSHLRAGTFTFVAGTFAVLEAEAGRAKGYATVPLVFAPVLEAGTEASLAEGDVVARVEVGEERATVEAWLPRAEGYRAAEVGVAYLVDVGFAGGEQFRKEILVPLAKARVSGGSVRAEVDAVRALPKLARATKSKPGPPKPLVTVVAPAAASYAWDASRGNLRLPPLLSSSARKGSGVRVAYYLELRGRLRRRRRVLIEAPLPPAIAARRP